MRDSAWLKSGIVLGLAFFLAVFLAKPIGVSTQFSVFGGMIQNAVVDSVQVGTTNGKTSYSSTNPYYNRNSGAIAKSIVEPANYETFFVLGIPIGALLGYLALRHTRKAEYAQLTYPPNYQLRAFLGGFLTLFGARMADGCTSGHMMSGMMQSSVSGYIFAAAVFAVAIPTAIFLHKE